MQTGYGEALKKSHDLDRQPGSCHEVVGVVMEISVTGRHNLRGERENELTFESGTSNKGGNTPGRSDM